MNLRGFHWNIQGKKFFELHLKFEELYNNALLKVDEIAEAIKEIPTSTALAMSATMTAASVVGPDIAAAVLGATGGTTGGGGGERPYNVTIQLELDGDVLAKTQKEFLGGRVRDALFGQ